MGMYRCKLAAIMSVQNLYSGSPASCCKRLGHPTIKGSNMGARHADSSAMQFGSFSLARRARNGHGGNV